MMVDPFDIGIKENEAAAWHEAGHSVVAVLIGGVPLKWTFLRDRKTGLGPLTATGPAKKKRAALVLAAGSAAQRLAGFGADLQAHDQAQLKSVWKKGDFNRLAAGAELLLSLPGVKDATKAVVDELMRVGECSGDFVRRQVERFVGDLGTQVEAIRRSACKRAKKSKKAA